MIQLDRRDARPIYKQIRNGLRHLVMTRTLQAGDRLPFVRALASSPAVNPNTIQRACESLEQEGCLYTVTGKGSFTAPQADMNTARRNRLLRGFDASAAELLFLGVTAGELAGRLETAARQTARGERSYGRSKKCG